eukprot:TRINITY_DN5525_c0_g1_i5.p1 TRINITY_DN5525_c0_g1~~TRINITY_DN5525_c0_g1_i5.p1  ORF type:complete len:546 (+),score=95.78 TRINITY_DN5525_c0_g1_i5:718-2355(+)
MFVVILLRCTLNSAMGAGVVTQKNCTCMQGAPYSPLAQACGQACGNGILDPGEDCDGGTGCTKSCECDGTYTTYSPKKLSCDSKVLLFVGPPLLGLAVVVAVLVPVLAFAIYKCTRKPDYILVSTNETNETSKLGYEEDFNPTTSREMEFGEEFPLTPSKTTLNFGCVSHTAPVGENITDTITFTNHSSSCVTMKPYSPNNPRFQLRFSPLVCTLEPGESVDVEFIMNLQCTTRLLGFIPVAVSTEREWTAPECHAMLQLMLESKLSTKLDFEEITLQDLLGEGGYGVVYKGNWRGQEVAVKVVKNQEVLHQSTREVFLREVEAMEQLRSPFVVNYVGACFLPKHLSIITEFMPLGNLRACMTQHAFSQELKIKCMLDCSRGLFFLHKSGIIHRDVKPDNLLMSSLEIHAIACCKLADFGCTRDFNTDEATQTFTKGVGTPRYMAPEILTSGKYSTKADVFSFAMLMWQLSYDKEPFSSEQFSTSWQMVEFVTSGQRLPLPSCSMPPALIALVASCWDHDPHKRPGFDEIVPALEGCFFGKCVNT